MTTYTMNGHRHSSTRIQPEILQGIVEKQVAQFTRARWRLQPRPEFSCLESDDPQMQIQAALAQIEDLLQKNGQLLETVLLLNRALNDAYSLLHGHEGIDQPERDRAQLSQEAQGCITLLCAPCQGRLVRSTGPNQTVAVTQRFTRPAVR